MYSFVLESIVLNNTSEIMNSIKSFINLKTTRVFSAGNENIQGEDQQKLDVFANEPNVPPALFGMDNVTLTPHVASATVETRRAMGDLTIENLLRFFNEGTVTTPVPECAHMKAAQ